MSRATLVLVRLCCIIPPVAIRSCCPGRHSIGENGMFHTDLGRLMLEGAGSRWKVRDSGAVSKYDERFCGRETVQEMNRGAGGWVGIVMVLARGRLSFGYVSIAS
jgi:hypothetical protein